MFEPLFKWIWGDIERGHRQTWRGCIAGCLLMPLCLVLILFVIIFPFWWDAAIIPALLIPDQLGLLHHVTQQDALTMPVSVTLPYRVQSPRSTTYLVFCSAKLPLEAFSVRSLETHQGVFVAPISPVNQYGARAVQGFPVGQFHVDQGDEIELSIQRFEGAEPSYDLFLARDFWSNNSLIIAVSSFLHFAVLVALLGAAYYLFNKDAIRITQTNQQKKRDNLDKMVEIANRVNRPKSES